ncbi:MAG: acetyl-CoA carboxylase carboxyltransferase subunit alpha [Nitrospinota bacterium]
MANHALDFEKPIVELEQKLEELRALSGKEDVDYSDKIQNMQRTLNELKKDTFLNLGRWQRTQLARHPQRPYALDYINEISTDFIEQHGDRHFGDGPSIITGFATMDDRTVMFIGQQKGRDTNEKMYRNFGMAHPEGYRKALRMMYLAEKFQAPIITMLDTPGAYPGIGAEERGQAEAVARNLIEMAKIKVPIITIVIGEGGSGGALALGVGNRALMLENSVYSVISPEGCAAILWKDQSKIVEAADSMALTAADLLNQGLIDEVITEPLGGAHRDVKEMSRSLKGAIMRQLDQMASSTPEQIVQQRRKRFRGMGAITG